jgi:hypothetical protein
VDLRDEFERRYLVWSLAQAETQVDAGFAEIRVVKSKTARSLLSVLDALDAAKRRTLVRLIVLRFHRRTAARDLINLTPLEEDLLAEIDLARIQVASLPGLPRVRRKALLLAYQRELSNFGESEAFGPGFQSFIAACGSYTIRTVASVGRTPAYWHDILSATGRPLIQAISVFSWLGISAQTVWDEAGAGDEDDIALQMAFFSRRFFGAVPQLMSE